MSLARSVILAEPTVSGSPPPLGHIGLAATHRVSCAAARRSRRKRFAQRKAE
jgi:hypothetical protein